MEITHTVLLTLLGVLSCLAPILCAWHIQRSIKRRDAEQERKDNARIKNEVTMLEGIDAALGLAIQTAKSVQRKDDKCNGDMTGALEHAETIKAKRKDFDREQGADNRK